MENTEDKKPKNPQAFPAWDMTFDHNPNTQLFSAGTGRGMSLRDYFAAKAMQGIVTAKLTNGGKDFVIGESGKSNQSVVGAAYGLADAMLKERGE